MKMIFNTIIILISILNLYPSPLYANDASDLQIYIVQVEAPEANFSSQSDDLESWYRSFLPTSKASTAESDRIVFSYRSVFKGFAARLSPKEVRAMESKGGFISARPEMKFPLHTTHSPSFLGLNHNPAGLWQSSNYGKGVIIGLLDTGIDPNHPSFSDEGMPLPPAKWRGACEFNHTTCNNKIIGARYFWGGAAESPLDDSGHGTHTASTAAGNFVKGANYFGNANGTAAGIAPLAHIAMYKVCLPLCYESFILAGMDAAIDDGVDILSISLGGSPRYFYADSIALGAFSAMQSGIVVSCSAGNDGPARFSLSNVAPWILTVGASSLDRSITATAVLGNEQSFNGQSGFQPRNFSSMILPLAYPNMLNTSDFEPFCSPESFVGHDIRGKIVVCRKFNPGITDRFEQATGVKEGGGVGMILVNDKQDAFLTFPEHDLIPTTHVSYAADVRIRAYMSSTSNPTASILFKGTTIGDKHAPVVAKFSSRGPNIASPGVLKPDILGPGVSILAAWPSYLQTSQKITKAEHKFNMISGTSMACPHLSGTAALIKCAHPDWSPAAIKSAIMTTADVVNHGHHPILNEAFHPANIFATGSGHVHPSRANDPGLVYDIKNEDYIPYLCGLDYTDRQVGVIVQGKVRCADISIIPETQLNYPSFVFFVDPTKTTSQTYSRTVTNVGEARSSYAVEIVPPPGIGVVVEPAELHFSKAHQKLQYNVTFSRPASARDDTVLEGFLKWNSCKHSVRSPIGVVFTDEFLYRGLD